MGKIHVMVNGLPGKMATLIADLVVSEVYRKDFELLPLALTGPEIEEDNCYVKDGIDGEVIKIVLLKPGQERKDLELDLKTVETFNNFVSYIKKDLSSFDYYKESMPITSLNEMIAVDFTQPDAANENAAFYCRNKINFVMGTTGGDRSKLEETVKNSEVCAVIAPNMAKQIVAFQAMMEYAANNFPNVFKDYNLRIVESHQEGKKDTSGTAKAMVKYFNELGIPFKPEQIEMIRDPAEQLTMSIPKEHLGGHGWHTYDLISKNGTVLFEFTHNVNGRDVYALGTLDAIRFLDKKVKEGNRGQVYSMIDVLKGG